MILKSRKCLGNWKALQVLLFAALGISEACETKACRDRKLNDLILSTNGQKCGTLYSHENFLGDEFHLNHLDQSVDTTKDYRTSFEGWGNTRSIRVEDNCTMNYCTRNYFQGQCLILKPGDYLSHQFMPSLLSVSCTCNEPCECDDSSLLEGSRTCGRAYVNGDCRSCEADYIKLEQNTDETILTDFPPEFSDRVQGVALRTGCNLTMVTEGSSGRASLVTRNFFHNVRGKVESYSCQCVDDADYTAVETSDSQTHPNILELIKRTPPFISVPTDTTLFIESFSDPTMEFHRGTQSALLSRKAGRLLGKAYILVIGAQTLDSIGLVGCPPVANQIGECRMLVNVDNLGLTDVPVEIEYAPIAVNDGNDARWIATLDDHLSNNFEEPFIPNAVIVYHDGMNDTTVTEHGSVFQRKLAAVNALRHRILDESFSNIVFVIGGLSGLAPYPERNPEEVIQNLEDAIDQKFEFPKPTLVVPTTTENIKRDERPWKMRNGEYYLRNIFQKLSLVTGNGKDPLGHGIVKELFSDQRRKGLYMGGVANDLLPATHPKVKLFRQLSLSPGRQVKHSRFALQQEKVRAEFMGRFKKYFKEKSSRRKVQDLRDEVAQNREKVEDRLLRLENELKELKRKVDNEL